jgi:predicted amino acid-binding ACT domain protein
MKLWDFKMMRNGRIEIGEKVADLLGMPDDSEVFTTMFRYEGEGKTCYEVVVSPFGPENYRELCSVTFQVRDVPGSLAQCAKFLKNRNIDILNSESIAFMPTILMTWVMLVDLSFYGDRKNLEREFKEAKDAKDSSLSHVDSMSVTQSNLAERYTKGSAPGNPRVTTRALRKMEKKAGLLKGNALELPESYLGFYGKKDAPVMLIGDTTSWVLSISFLDESTKLWRIKFNIPDKPGAVYEVSEMMAANNINILAGYTQVLIYYKKMLFEIVADVSKCKAGFDDLGKTLDEKAAALGKEYSVVSAEKIDFR